MSSSSNNYLNQWIEQQAKLYQPDKIVWYDGSEQSYKNICSLLVEQDFFKPLNQEIYPNSYWCISEQNDVARVEDKTFICSESESDCGPTNNWADPKETLDKLNTMMQGCMKGKNMYVIPYLMGPIGSKYSRFGVELTDSPYVVANMHIMTSTGEQALKHLGDNDSDFVKGCHSMGTIDPEKRYIAHFPEQRLILSYNTNYGGNVLQGKKCFALRIASVLAKEQGWLAEHMLILAITNPKGEKNYIAAAFPSACGKTNLAMLVPPETYEQEGWRVETIGDDIAWLNFGSDGRLYAINPEQGFFGVAPGTSEKNNFNAIKTLEAGNTIFTNTAYDPVNKVPWWEGMTKDIPEKLINWKGEEWSPQSNDTAAHPNSRFTTPASQCPSLSDEWQDPQGVPISAIVFGGRRSKSCPLVYETFNWQHGVFVGATMASETTAAAIGKVGRLRHDPMAMRPFIGYHVGDYFQHWLDMGKKENLKLPKIFHVNWFRTDENNNFMWPGFGENMRVLEWILKRVNNECEAQESALGYTPKPSDIRIEDLNIETETLDQLLKVISNEFKTDIESQKEFFNSIGSKIPQEIIDQHEELRKRLDS